MTMPMSPASASASARSRDATPGTASETERNVNTSSLPDILGSRVSLGPDGVPHSRGPISPPPLRRLASAMTATEVESPPPQSDGATFINEPVANERDMPRSSDAESNVKPPDPITTPSRSSHTKSRSQGMTVTTPKALMAGPSNYTINDIASRLKEYSNDIRQDHAQTVAHAIESTVATERRVFTGRDLFAGLKCIAVPEIKGQTMRIKSKIDARIQQHQNAKKERKELQHYDVVCIKTNKEAVPSYRFHHVEIKKNILTPNTMLTFVPHHRDLDNAQEARYEDWLRELEEIDLKSGFNPMNRIEKRDFIVRSEQAATMSLYLEMWLDKLAIRHCNTSTLIRYFASLKYACGLTPRYVGPGDYLGHDALRAAEMFIEGFRLAFGEDRPTSKAVDLRQVLLRNESADNVMDNKSATKETSAPQPENIDEIVESSLGTYCYLGCSICFSHSCDHGEFDSKGLKRSFSLFSSLVDVLRRKRERSSTAESIAETPCSRRCHRSGVTSDQDMHRKEWTEDEHILLRSLVITSDHGRLKTDPICLVAEFLNRNCYDVHNEFLYLDISRPQPGPVDQAKPRNVAWYDRKKKMLLGDWQDHLASHEHQGREIVEPCSHDGPCSLKTCSCVDAGVLCEKFCSCTVDTCSHKFTGCACHSQGKTCHAKQKDRPCICVQLNRECDPLLCSSCGALEHADLANADDIDLHSTGCQNCELQRGVFKSLLLGRSQLDGVGYGLFTAEDIAQDEFVVEYVGELITQDEGVRREARRGDVFDEESHVSYLFTLLDYEGIWVDAAIYGNLSRYINHASASEHEARGCNITPRILYVNGEYRIKFTALRDIKAGEELFFNYGENFPNLTKKLQDQKEAEKAEGVKAKVRGVGRPRRAEAGARVARKAPKPEHLKVGRPRSTSKPVQGDSFGWDKRARVHGLARVKPRKRKRGTQDDSIEDEQHPATATDKSYDITESNDSDESIRITTRRPGRKPRSHSEAEEHGTPPKTGPRQPRTRGKRGGHRQGSGRPKKPQVSEATSKAEATTSLSSPKATTLKQITLSDSDNQEIEIMEDSDDQDIIIRNRTSRNRRLPAKFRDDEVERY